MSKSKTSFRGPQETVDKLLQHTWHDRIKKTYRDHLIILKYSCKKKLHDNILRNSQDREEGKYLIYFNLNAASMLQLCCKYAADILQNCFLTQALLSIIFVVQNYLFLPIYVTFWAFADPKPIQPPPSWKVAETTMLIFVLDITPGHVNFHIS